MVLHTIGCAIQGSLVSLSAQVQKAFPLDPKGICSIWAGPRCIDPRTAAFLNAFQAQATLREDYHTPSQSHPGAVIVPAAAAAAQCQAVSGAEFLAAVVTGYEVSGHVGRALLTNEFRSRGFRTTGIFGPLGAAVAAGRILGLTPSQLSHAIGLAANAAGGLRQWSIDGSPDMFFQNGQAAATGINAALLAKAGMEAPRHALEGHAGLARAYAGEAALDALPSLVDALGSRYAILESFFKRIPAPGGIQTVIQAAAKLSGHFSLDGVRAIQIFTNQRGKTNPGLDNPGPFTTSFQAHLSNQFGVAAALKNGNPTTSTFSLPHDPAILRLAAIATVHLDPHYETVYPERQPGRVEVELTDGRQFRQELADNEPLSDKEVRENWLVSSGPVLGEDAALTWLSKWERFLSLTPKELISLIGDL